MRIWLTVFFLGWAVTGAVAASTPHQDALIGNYFAIWDDNSRVTPENVAKLYASRLIYYGHAMTRESLYRDKLNFIRRWPERRYSVEPGSASKTCDAEESRCVLSAVLVWRTGGPRGSRAGRSRVRLTLAREDGSLKIVQESGVTLNR